MDDKMIIDLFYKRSEQAIAETRTKYGTIVRRTAFHILNNYQETKTKNIRVVTTGCLQGLQDVMRLESSFELR